MHKIGAHPEYIADKPIFIRVCRNAIGVFNLHFLFYSWDGNGGGGRFKSHVCGRGRVSGARARPPVHPRPGLPLVSKQRLCSPPVQDHRPPRRDGSIPDAPAARNTARDPTAAHNGRHHHRTTTSASPQAVEGRPFRFKARARAGKPQRATRPARDPPPR